MSQDVRLSLSVSVRSVLPTQEDMAQRFRFPRPLGFSRAREPSHCCNGELWPAGLALPLGSSPFPPGTLACFLGFAPGPCSGEDGRALWGSSLAPPGPRGGGRQTLGPAQRPCRPRSPPRAAPSAVGGRAQPAGKQPGSPGQPRGWAATCFRSDRNRPEGAGRGWARWGWGVSLGNLGLGPVPASLASSPCLACLAARPLGGEDTRGGEPGAGGRLLPASNPFCEQWLRR